MVVRTQALSSARGGFKYLCACRCFAVTLINSKGVWVIYGSKGDMGASIYLKTDRHDDVRFPLLGLIWLDARVNELYKLIKDSLTEIM